MKAKFHEFLKTIFLFFMMVVMIIIYYILIMAIDLDISNSIIFFILYVCIPIVCIPFVFILIDKKRYKKLSVATPNNEGKKETFDLGHNSEPEPATPASKKKSEGIGWITFAISIPVLIAYFNMLGSLGLEAGSMSGEFSIVVIFILFPFIFLPMAISAIVGSKQKFGTCGAMAPLLIIYVLWIYAFVMPVDDTPDKKELPRQYTVAEKLAIIDSNPGREAEYDRLLNGLKIKCGETKIGVSDTAVRGTQVMKDKRGVSMSALEFLVALDGSIPNGSPIMNCTEIAAVLIAITGS
jgi:hypothetical protein